MVVLFVNTKMTHHTLKWFTARIGKRIFRDDSGCGCPSCFGVVQNGLIISDKLHADELYCTQNDFGNERIELNYRDKI